MQDRSDRSIGAARTRREKSAGFRLGSYEFRKKGISRFDLRDPYHFANALTWPQFTAALLLFYATVNFVFAMLYWLAPGSVANARPGSFGDVYFFSMETLATVGYGDMYPATVYGRTVAGIEIVSGLGVTAILTGLTFVRFSRPRSKMVFAANPVVATYRGKPTLMVRIANGRASILTDAVAKLNVLIRERAPNGRLYRRAQELRLERAHIPAFPLTWTLMHLLDERSPLHGFDEARMIAADIRVFVTIEARDPMLSATIQDIRNYAPEEICFGMRYADAVIGAPDGMMAVDLTRIGALEPDTGEDYVEQGWSEHEEQPD